MAIVKVYNMAGEETGETALPDAIFGIEPNKYAMHEAAKNHLANMRQGTQSALTRAEVSGGGAKPYRQKGTGHARQGSTRVPQYTHGGVAFAPKPRDYSYRINKKLRRLALKSALSAKAVAQSVVVIDSIELGAIKTKDFKKFLDAVGIGGKALVITPEVRRNVVMSARNIPKILTAEASLLSVYDIINSDKIVVDAAALPKIEEVYA
ncbi:MAG: 50S ribosomal protein L4 [Oscillospiraceae bacterium]|jgi:large subunit ribosomal protein L4|nr:50S ribosomal protein L4 [Oscillospiraceae bacterium]